jgi:ROK family
MPTADLSANAGAVAPTNDARTFNRKTVLTLAMAQGVLTRQDAVAMSGLSKATVSRVVRELIDAHVLLEGPAVTRGMSGRPTTSLIFNVNCACACGVTLTHDAAEVRLADARGVVFHETRHRLGGDVKAGNRVRQLAKHILAKLPSAEVPVAITIAVPNAVAPVSSSADDDSTYARLAHELGRHLDAEIDTVDDADLAVLGEVRDGAAQGSGSAVYLALEPMTRAGVYLNGRLLRGRSGLVGQFGAIAYGGATSIEDFLREAISRQDQDGEDAALYFLCQVIASAYSPEVIVLSSNPVLGGPAAVSRLARRLSASGAAQLPRLAVGELGPRTARIGTLHSSNRRVERLLLDERR